MPCYVQSKFNLFDSSDIPNYEISEVWFDESLPNHSDLITKIIIKHHQEIDRLVKIRKYKLCRKHNKMYK